MVFFNCFTICSNVLISDLVVIVILDKSGFSVIPTVMLSILKFLDLNKLVILNSTPGLFSTITDNIYKISLLLLLMKMDLLLLIKFMHLLPYLLNQYLGQQKDIHLHLDQ